MTSTNYAKRDSALLNLSYCFYVYALKHVLKGSSISLLSFISFNYGRDCAIRVKTSRTTIKLKDPGLSISDRLSIGYILFLCS